MVSIAITSEATGPLLRGQAPAVIGSMLDEIQTVVASKAFSEVHLLLDRSIRNPTPYYETQITRQVVADDIVVHDRGIVYGPWLEGTGSRNKTTRFKGYASFRRARQNVEREIPSIAAAVVARFLPQLGGKR